MDELEQELLNWVRAHFAEARKLGFETDVLVLVAGPNGVAAKTNKASKTGPEHIRRHIDTWAELLK